MRYYFLAALALLALTPLFAGDDGFFSRSEKYLNTFTQSPEEVSLNLFETMDENRDNVITLAELKKYRKIQSPKT
ncbi:MAG: hypothetical protein GC136_00940 [Alphaproteobacteria bacterium]|nr:hypothetical protein [Alphaproteobacteria bacterium]